MGFKWILVTWLALTGNGKILALPLHGSQFSGWSNVFDHFVVAEVCCVLPEASQEGLLRPYRSYADVTLFHYYVPREVSQANFQFAAFMDDPGCPTREVYM